jgi:hypothetical protein
VPINKISNLSLKVIVFLIGHIIGSASLHQASRAHMNCAVQCLNEQIFDRSTTLLDFMKRQLTECHMRRHRNFGFGTILSSFSLRGYQVSTLERRYEGMSPLSQRYADGRCCFCDRVGGGLLRPSTISFFLGGHDKF